MSEKGRTNPSRMPVDWGDSMMNQLPGTTRKRRKRLASKKRREQLRRELRESL